MSWDGYFTLDGQEFVNAARTEAYAAEQQWFLPVFKADDLPAMLGHDPYVSPLADEAPWVDPDIAESYDFFGFYPLDVTGISDSSRISTVIESTLDGGVPGRLRHATKTVVFNGLLLGHSDKAVEYGMAWLRRVLVGDQCANPEHNSGLGTTLSFLSAKPTMEDDPLGDPQTVLEDSQRYLRRFSVNAGPTVSARRTLTSCGGEVWVVTFTGVAGNPYTFGHPRPVLAGWLDGVTVNPWQPGGIPGETEDTPITHTEVVCGDDTWEPIFDPLCPALVVPPPPPSVPLGCLEIPEAWDRRSFTLPGENVPQFGDVVPVIGVYAAELMRNVRLRFYDNSTGDLDPEATPCGYSTDIVISYLPAESTMTIDAAAQEVWVETVIGQRRRADSLVFNTEGRPLDWPALTCGHAQIVTLDLEEGAATPAIDLTLVPRAV